MRIRVRILERSLEQNLFDGVGSGLHSTTPGEILAQGFTNEVPERHAAGSGCLRRTAVQVSREK
jgi:hypothetical protein